MNSKVEEAMEALRSHIEHCRKLIANDVINGEILFAEDTSIKAREGALIKGKRFGSFNKVTSLIECEERLRELEEAYRKADVLAGSAMLLISRSGVAGIPQ